MATNIKISAGLAAPLCAAVLLATLSAPAFADDSLFSQPVAAPTTESAAPATESAAPAAAPVAKPSVKPKPKPKKVVKRKPAPKPAAPAAAAQPATLPPVVVEAPAPAPQTGFYDQMPKQYLLNKMFSPASLGQTGKDPGQGGAAPAQGPDDGETQPNGMPRKYLLNRMFNSSSLEPSRNEPDPRSFMAQAAPDQPEQPAQPSWFDQATSALGLGARPQGQQTTNLPPVNVTAPANPSPVRPAPAAVAPPQREPSWIERIPGLGGAQEPIPNYADRPKLVVPTNHDALPPPNPVEESKVQRPPDQEALTRPPSSFTEKVRGADGKVSGFTDQDSGKKGWFNWF